MSQDALGQLKHLKTAKARWPFPDAQFRRIIAEARDENPVDKPLMTKVSKKSAQTGSDSSNSMHDLRNRSRL